MSDRFVREANVDGLLFKFAEPLSGDVRMQIVNLLRSDYGLIGAIHHGGEMSEVRVASWAPYGRSPLPESILASVDGHIERILDGQPVPATNLTRHLRENPLTPSILLYAAGRK